MDLFDRFHKERAQDNWSAYYNGLYRGVVVETNDPMRMHRVRVRISDMYLPTEPPENVLWATMANWFGGGPMGGSWVSPSINDLVWVAFEKGHPYNPIVVGFADPVRTKKYVHDSLYGAPPVPFDELGEIAERPDYGNESYMPKDERPYSMGFRSPYGQEFILNYTGFFAKSHAKKPSEAGTNPVTDKEFEVSKKSPESNKPDTKFMALLSGYGSVMVLHDAGHEWQEEMSGDAVDDEQYLIDRYKYNLEFLNETKAEDRDQRRFEIRTRAGHKGEFRDVGFNKSREGEYGKSVKLSSKNEDERWIKFRSKGGHFLELIDIGFDSEQDTFYKRLNKSEFGLETEHEDAEIDGKDKRMIRFQSRHGHMIVLDDRGSDSKDADSKSDPRGPGILFRSRQGGTIAVVDRPEMQGIHVQNPDGSGLEVSMRHGYATLTTRPSESNIVDPGEHKLSPVWPQNPVRGQDPETTSHHLMLDERNCSARLKTGRLQGVEFRDTCPHGGCGRSWAEMRDEHDRGLYFNADKGYAIWRGKPNANNKSKQWIVIDDNGSGKVLVRNETGSVQIVANQDTVEIRGKNIAFHADETITMKAGREVVSEGGGTHWSVKSGEVGTEGHLRCQVMSGFHDGIHFLPGPATSPPSPLPGNTPQVEPHSVDEHKPEDEKKEDDCKKSDAYKKAQKEAEDAKKKADESKSKADAAFQNAKSAQGAATAANKAQKAAKGTSGHAALAAAFKASVQAYKSASDANKAANKQYRDDKKAAKDAKKKADKICSSGARNTQRGCAPNKSQMGPVPPFGGGGGPGGDTPPSVNDPVIPPPEPSDETSTDNGITPPPPFEPLPDDPLSDSEGDGNGGVLWYGVSEAWVQEIMDNGLLLSSLSNLRNDPSNPTNVADRIDLAVRISTARGKDFVKLSQKRFGGKGAILRIRAVDDPVLLIDGETNADGITLKTYQYLGDISPEFIEVYEIVPELPAETNIVA